MSRTTDYIIGNDIKFDDQESGASHSHTERVSKAKEEYSKAKVEWYVDEFLKVGEKRSLAELATGIIDCETTMSHTQFLGIFDDVLKYKLSKLNKERGRS
tara:strand:+ start:687 stop:986 length:300 start_codon:yes stop_codon:yes gene_type:complete